jgi:hypothetical protein
MPIAVLDQPPAIGSYGRVLRRYDLDPSTARRRFVSYSVHLISLRCELGGRIAFTLFFPDNHKGAAAAHRATRLGWTDETLAWSAENEVRAARTPPRRKPAAPEAAPAPEPTLDDESAEAIQVRVKAMSWDDLGAVVIDEKIRVRRTRRSMEKAVVRRLQSNALAAKLLHDPAVDALADELLGPDDGPAPEYTATRTEREDVDDGSAVDLPVIDTDIDTDTDTDTDEASMDPTETARNVPPKTSAVEHGVRNLAWSALREKAKELGVPASGQRAAMEDKVIAKLSKSE